MTGEEALNAMHDRTEALRAYVGSEQHVHLMGLLFALEALYKDQLVTVAPEGLLAVQGPLKQVIALRGALTSPGMSPRV